jgi:hypothetical protein
VAILGVAPCIHVGLVFGEGGGALGLEARVFGREVAVGLGVAGHVAFGVAQEVVGEEVLGVAARARAHRPQQDADAPADLGGDLVGDHLDLDGEGAGALIGADLLEELERLVRGLGHGLEAAGPGGARGDKAHMAHDRDVLARKVLDGLQASRAVDGVGAAVDRVARPAQVVVRGCPPRGGSGRSWRRR